MADDKDPIEAEDTPAASDHSPATDTPAPDASPEAPLKALDGSDTSGDASRGEVAIYAFGNVEGAIADRFPETLQNILIVVAHMNPILLGLIMGLRMLWDGIMDPIMAHISDNTKSRFGRRRPYILFGGVSRVLFLVAFIALMPLGDQVVDNHLMEAQKHVDDANQIADKNNRVLQKAYQELPSVDTEMRAKIIDVLEGRPPRSWITAIIEAFTPDKDQTFLTVSRQNLEDIETHRPTLIEDVAERQQLVDAYTAEIAELEAQGVDPESQEMLKAIGLRAAASEALKVADELIEESFQGESDALMNIIAVRYLLTTYSDFEAEPIATLEEAQAAADALLAERGLPARELFPAPVIEEPVTEVTEEVGLLEGIGKKISETAASAFDISWLTEGIDEYFAPSNYQQRKLVIYLIIAYLIFATLATINSAPYYALGIELSPSYNGRTQVVVYRSIMNQIMGLVAPWVPVFCFSLWFTTAFDALFWVAVAACVIGIPSTVLMFFKTRERTRATIKKAGERPNLFRSMWQIGRERDFLRILFLFVFIGLVNGIFQQIGFFLNVYWITGSALSGATLGAQVAMLAWGLGLILLPIIKWACDKFQKHRVLMFAIIWMAIGTGMKWWLMNPEHPEYQFILPFFFSVGIATVYNVLPSMMADVTDLDELKYGVRREGMFGAVMGFLMKLIGSITPIAAGVVLVLSGFNAELEYRQEESTILNMRLMYSFVPAVMLLLALVAIWKYPLTRERVAEIKDVLKRRHDAEDAEAAALEAAEAGDGPAPDPAQG